MNIEPDIFDYLETTSLEPHDDYTSEISYKDQKIIWNRLKTQQREIERLNNKIKEQSLLLIEFQDMEQKVDIYRSRCKKAVEYIKMYKCDYSPYELTDSAIRNVLNILNGSADK